MKAWSVGLSSLPLKWFQAEKESDIMLETFKMDEAVKSKSTIRLTWTRAVAHVMLVKQLLTLEGVLKKKEDFPLWFKQVRSTDETANLNGGSKNDKENKA